MSAALAPIKSPSRWRKSSGAPRLAAGVVLVLLASLLVAGIPGDDKQPRPQTWAQRVPSATLKNWYKVDDDVYRSEQPTRKGFMEIQDKGIKTVINLRYGNSDAKLVEGLDLVLIEIGMTAWEFSDNDILRALKAIESAPKPVLIHCLYGSDRTGVVMAMYRIIFLNWSKEEALAEMKRGGFGFHWIYMNIPAFIKRVDVARFKERLGWARTG
jgi:tyrosine-protein phosphatase SIW14